MTRQTQALRAIDLRASLRRLSSGLIVYALVGLVAATIAAAALVWVNGRIDNVRREAAATIQQLAATTERTASALRDASRTTDSFSTTLHQASDALPQASAQLGKLRTDLSALEGQLRSVNIFGQTPLASAADAIGQVVVSMEGLDTQLSLMGVVLTANADALTTNSTSLTQLADNTSAVAARLRSGVIEDSLEDVQLVVTVLFIVFTGLSAVPAFGALTLGLWLRRELRRYDVVLVEQPE